MKKIRKLVEEHLSQKDTFEEDDELEENSLVKSTVNDLLEGNIYETATDTEILVNDLRSVKRKEFPLEEAFSSKNYAGKKISRKSFDFEEHENSDFSGTDSDADESRKIMKVRKKNVRKTQCTFVGNSSDLSESESSETDKNISEDSEVSLEKDRSLAVGENCAKKRVKFTTVSSGNENSTNEDDSDQDVTISSNDDESEVEDDSPGVDSVEDHNSFLYSQKFRDEPSEIDRGKAIRNQLSVWEALLESRITLQKCLIASNKLPKPEKFGEISESFSQEEKDLMIESREKVWDLLEKLILVQDKWRRQCAEYTETIKSKETMPKDFDNNADTPLKVKRRKLAEYPEILEKQYNEFIPYRNNVIQKWNDRTKISSGKWAKSNFSAFDQPVLKQIEQIMSDKHRLIQRTFIKRSAYSIIGDDEVKSHDASSSSSANFEIDREIFDDDDFYHKLIRDYIARKTSDISDLTQLGRKWIHLQSLRNKMKRKIDTRRTKGRKINFDVHPKLVNFMAPVLTNRWEDSAINELFSSVFGKNLINT